MAPIKGRVRLQLLQELDMSAIKVATMATSRADPGKVIGLLKDPVTWPRWSTFESASSVAMVRDARGRAPHHEDPLIMRILILRSGHLAASRRMKPSNWRLLYTRESRLCPHSHTPNAITTAIASPNQVMAYCI
jgi:hypothetical protein